MCIVIDFKLSGVLEEFSITSRFPGLKNAKINFLKKNKVFECDYYQIQVQVIANLPSRLEKHQTLEILLMTGFFL